MTDRIQLVLKGYPRLSETFIAQEILELERAGLAIDIVSLRHPTDQHTHPVHREISAPVFYLPEYLHQEPLRVLAGLFTGLFRGGFWKCLNVFCRDLMRDFTVNRVRRFGQALVLARERGREASFFYAHFLHTPCSVTRYAALISDKRFAISAHAKDIWTIPDWEIVEKLEACEWLVTCTRSGAEHLAELSPDPSKVHLVYHGIDLSRFPLKTQKTKKKPDGANAKQPVAILTVGRAVAKKGIDTLLHALARLPDGFHWRWTHIGGGPLKGELEALAKSLKLDDRCEFQGALPQETVLETYRKSDLFVLPSRIDETGDRDGLPNVVVEAQSQGLAIVSTRISGIPELISEGENGLLVEPDDVEALAEAILALGRDPELRAAMGRRGAKRVQEQFSHKASIGRLIALLETSVGK